MRYTPFRRPETGEASALETDVVRFVAVVGLTLMVVFALVHALPYRGEPEEPPVNPQPPMAQDLILIPRAELDELSLASRRADAREAELAGELAAARQELRDVREELALRHQATEPEPELEREFEPPPEPQAEPAPEPGGEPPAPPAALEPLPDAAPGNAAFVLRFRDDDVYLNLLGRERVRSYLHVPGLELTYEISGDPRGRLGFALVYGLASQRMYRIPEGMVPRVLIEATRRFDGRLAARDDLQFLVVLSDRIREQVGRLESAGVGTWDILGDETVVAAAEGVP